MPLDVARAAIELVLSRDPTGLELSFFGGEPLLHVGWLEEVTELAQQRLAARSPEGAFVVHLNTNASLVDERVLRYVRSQRAINAFVSLDGPAEVHDRHRVDARGRGSYEEVREGLVKLADAGARVVVMGVVNPDTAGALGAVMKEFLGLPVVRAHLTCNLHRTWDGAALGALRQGMVDAMALWGDHFRAGHCFVLEPFTTKILTHLHGAIPCHRRCQLGAHELVVAPSGRIYPCGEMVGDDQNHDLAVGDVYSGLYQDKLSTLAAAKSRIEETCAPCALRARCASSCGCKHLALTGELGRVTEGLCNLEEAIIDAADALASTLYAEECRAFLRLFYETRWQVAAGPRLIRLRRGPEDTAPDDA
jgi:uncharacterized protein